MRTWATGAAPPPVIRGRRTAEAGQVRPEFAADYLAKGPRTATVEQAELDRSDGFTNLAPQH